MLARLNQVPQRQLLNLSSLPIDGFRRGAVAFQEKHQSNHHPRPFKSAAQFYVFNHMVAMLGQKFGQVEQLPDWANAVVDEYIKLLTEQSQRLVTYMMYITVRESRHLQMTYPKWWAYFAKNHHPAAVQFFKDMNSGEEGVLGQFKDTSKSINCTVAEFFQTVADIFWQNTWSSGFGGPMWAKVTEALLEALHGRLSMEMLLDVGYALAHNGGPIFNKGLVYSGNDSDTLHSILNHQRAGLLLSTTDFDDHLTPQQLVMRQKLLKHLPAPEYSYDLLSKAEQSANKEASKLLTEKKAHLAKQNAFNEQFEPGSKKHKHEFTYYVTPQMAVGISDSHRQQQVDKLEELAVVNFKAVKAAEDLSLALGVTAGATTA